MTEIGDFVKAVEESILATLNVKREAGRIAFTLKMALDKGPVEIIDIDRKNLKKGVIPSPAYEQNYNVGRRNEMIHMGLITECHFWDAFSSGRQGGGGYDKYFLTHKAVELVHLLEDVGYYDPGS